MITIDLENKYAKIDVIKSESGVNSLSTTKNMAKYTNAIAALNADYFAKRPNLTNEGQSIGFWGSNGKVYQSSADENISSNTMGSFILDNKNNTELNEFRLNGEMHVKLDLLMEEGYVEENIEDPVTGDKIPRSHWIKIYIARDGTGVQGNEYIDTCILDDTEGKAAYCEPTNRKCCNLW